MVSLILALALTGQAPRPAPAPVQAQAPRVQLQPTPATSRRQAELAATAAKRKAAATAKARGRAVRAQRDYIERRSQEAFAAKMAPVIAKQQADAARLTLEQQRANALSTIAGAARQEAATDRARLRLEQMEAGVPFIPTPNGAQPYPYAAGATP